MTATALDLTRDNLTDYGNWLDGVADIVAEWEITELLHLRAALEDSQQQLKGAIAAVELRALAIMEPGHTEQVAGAGAFTVEVRGKKVCHGARLAAALAARVADESFDRETGAMLPPAEICGRTAAEIVEVFGNDTASTTFRAGKVKERNLKPADFYDYTDGVPTVRFAR